MELSLWSPHVSSYSYRALKLLSASPLLSDSLSVSFSVSLSDGPDNMALIVNGQNTTSFLIGSNLTMLCSVQSNPPAQLQWAFRGEPLNTTGPLLVLYSVSEDQSGSYSCLAFNNQTNMDSNITTHILIGSEFSNKVILTSIFAHFLPNSPFLWFISRIPIIRMWISCSQCVAPSCAVNGWIFLLIARQVVQQLLVPTSYFWQFRSPKWYFYL